MHDSSLDFYAALIVKPYLNQSMIVLSTFLLIEHPYNKNRKREFDFKGKIYQLAQKLKIEWQIRAQ